MGPSKGCGDSKFGPRSKQNETTPAAAEKFDSSATCSECGQQTFAQSNTGEWFCEECGAVQSATEIEFTEPGWRPSEERRTGPASSQSYVSIGTTIGHTNSHNNPRWANLNKRIDNKTRTLRHGLKELRALSSSLEANEQLIEEASYLFRRAAANDILRGHSIEAMAAACIHATAREDSHVPFPLKQIGEASPVELDNINTAFRKLLQEFDLKVKPPSPVSFIPRFGSDAGLSASVRRDAKRITNRIIEEEEHIGQSPTGVAAAALYGAAKVNNVEVTQGELAETAYVSVVTLSRQWQSLEKYAEGLKC